MGIPGRRCGPRHGWAQTRGHLPGEGIRSAVRLPWPSATLGAMGVRLGMLVFLGAAGPGCMADPSWRLPPTGQVRNTTPGRRSPQPADATLPRWRTAAFSHGGRPIELLRLGKGPVRVLWLGGIHGSEPEGAVATDRLPRSLRGVPGLLDRVTVLLVRNLNPDGRASRRRANARGVDLNRNFPARNFRPSPRTGPRPLSENESRFLFDLIRTYRPHY